MTMRPQYELRSVVLALTVVACGRIDVDLLPQANNTDTPADAQTSDKIEDAGPPSDEAGVRVDDASATLDDASATLDDAGSAVQPDTGIPPVLPNIAVELDAAVGTATADAGAAAPDLDAAHADAAAADGSTPSQLDAAAPDASAADAGMSGQRDAGTDAATVSCAGTVVFGLCWYLGAQGESCTNVCSTHSGYDISATSYVGASSQGGSLANCHQVLSALGTTATVNAGMRSDSLGLGCHIWNDGQPWWLDSPAANPDSAIPVAQIACGCQR